MRFHLFAAGRAYNSCAWEESHASRDPLQISAFHQSCVVACGSASGVTHVLLEGKSLTVVEKHDWRHVEEAIARSVGRPETDNRLPQRRNAPS